MPFDEYVGWCKYFRARPPGYQEDMRTYYIMSSMADIKKKPEEIFPTIRAVVEYDRISQPHFEEGAIPANNMLTFMKKAKGGDGEFDLNSLIKEGAKRHGIRSEHGSSRFSSRVEKSSLRGGGNSG